MSATAGIPARQQIGAARPSFLGSVRGELLKLRRQLSLWLMIAGGILLLALVVVAEVSAPNARAGMQASPARNYWDALSIYTGLFNTGSGIILLVISSRLVGMEYSSGTIRVLLGRGVGRLQLWAAKLTALALVGLGLLVGYFVLAAASYFFLVRAFLGSFQPVAAVPNFTTDLGLNVLAAGISIVVCIALGTTAAVVGRSLAVGVPVAMAFFPADNFGTLILFLIDRITNQSFFLKVSAYLLGPNLNTLGAVLQTDHAAHSIFSPPLVKVDATHTLVVIAAWIVAFLVLSAVLLWRRDVRE